MQRINRQMTVAMVLAGMLLCSGLLQAQNAPSPTDKAQAAIDKGVAYLRSQQKPDGSWQSEAEPVGISALVLKAVVQDPKFNAQTDFIAKGYQKLLTYQLESGGIYKDLLANYNTAIAISALAAADAPQYKPAIDKAVAYLTDLQWTDKIQGLPKGEQAVDEKHPNYGGWGYGRKGRPDGSNVQLALDALHDAGLKPSDPAFQAALKFVSRMQNLSETNDQPWSGNDGGFVYTPAAGGESFAGEYTAPDGRRMLRSYGSMTYAGLKSMIYAGLSKDDPRVKAAWQWIISNWTLGENPGMRLGNPENAQQGMYYYYHTLARALHAYDEPVIADAQGNKHDWRIELIEKLSTLQKPDGSWAGEKKWMEDNPILTTSYVVLALEEVQQDLKEHPAQP